MPDAAPTTPRASRLSRVAIAAGGLLVAYTAFGFLAAPRLVARLIVKGASSELHREVTIAKVRVNPLALSVTVDGLAVKHRDGRPFVAWESLYVRLAPLRLFSGELGLAEIRLVRPAVHVGIAEDGALTFQDLLAPAAPPVPDVPRAAKGDGLALYIGRLAVEEARVSFRDATRHPAFDRTLGPLTIRLESFRTKGDRDSPYSFSGTTDSGEAFRWTGTVRSQPLHSSGTLAFERIQLARYAAYIRDEAPIDVRDGLVDARTRYDLEWSPARHVFRLEDGEVTVERLAVGPRGVADAPVKLGRIEVRGLQVDALARAAKVGEFAIRGGAVRVAREAGGGLELARMAPPSPKVPPPPWDWSIGAVAVHGLDVTLEDRAAARPVSLPLTGMELRLERLRPAADATCPFALSFAWNGRGRVAVEGPIQPFAAKGTLAVDAADLDLAPLDPYLEPATAARLAGGRAGAKVRIAFDTSGGAPRWSIAGDVRVDALSIAEKGNDELFRWRALEVAGIDAGSTPAHASVKLVRLLEPRLKAYVWEDGTTSFSRARPAAPASPAAAPAPAAAQAAGAPAWQTAIDAVQVVGGRLAVVDRSVTPPAVLNVSGAEARVTRLSSDRRVRSAVDVRLRVEGASPVRISGTLNPLQKEAYTDLAITSHGVDLTPLDPYAGKFLGYGIHKGKLDLDLRYRIEDRALVSTNVVRVNQFTLGEHTDSPDATKIPVRLALALLQDKDGVILLDVPVEGRLDDPEFHLGKVIWHTVLSVLVKVATSPFRALAALVGGGDQADLSLAEFAAGTAEPLAAAQERIALLARSLAKRPALALDLEGSADLERDGPVLRRAALERELRRAKAAALRPPLASLEQVTITPEERPRLVRAAYDAAFPTTPATPVAPAAGRPAAGGPSPAAATAPPPPDMEERLAAAMAVPPDALRALAAERAERARDALVAAGVDQARLFLVQGGARAEKEKGARVYFTAR
jgi:hypothetical protein